MSRTGRRERFARRPAFLVEGLESRSLMTVMPIVHPHAALAQAVSSPPSASDLGPPTPHELAKQRFVSRLVGTFETARGRFQNEPVQVGILSSGGSNQSLHVESQMQVFLYSLPDAPPTGQIALMPKNVSTTGSVLLLDLTSDGASFSHGLPTHFTWTVNSGGSGGTWSNASGQGTLDIAYLLARKPRGIHAAGRVTVTIQGLVQTNHNLTNDIFLPGNRPNS